MNVVSSPGYVLDSSPPDIGVVLDGPPSDAGDVDYWTDWVLAAHWAGFGDPHSGVVEYWWAIGTCATCSDVQAFVSVGLNQGKKMMSEYLRPTLLVSRHPPELHY